MRCFVALPFVVVALVVHHSMAVKLCGKHLVIHVGNVCAATDCDGTDEAMPTSSFRGKKPYPGHDCLGVRCFRVKQAFA